MTLYTSIQTETIKVTVIDNRRMDSDNGEVVIGIETCGPVRRNYLATLTSREFRALVEAIHALSRIVRV